MKYRVVRDDELYHYGVLGMKWGHRKSEGGSSSIFRRREKSEDYKTVEAIRKKKIKEMSNEELRTANNRLQLEAQYKNLTKRRIFAGEQFARDYVNDVAKETRKTAAKTAVKAMMA